MEINLFKLFNFIKGVNNIAEEKCFLYCNILIIDYFKHKRIKIFFSLIGK